LFARICSTVLPVRRFGLKSKVSKTQMSKQLARKNFLLLVVSLFFMCALWAQNQKDEPPPQSPPQPYKIPPEDAAKPNPVKPTAESLAKGKKLYGYDCAMCHGEKGDGKGDLAADMKNITDFTKPDVLKNRTDGELFYEIRNGKGDMPPEGDRAKNDDIWNMVNYIRSLAKK
jgi:mono/diheme cytochrome c family protein